jgi:peptide/nickel transport system permease protein
MTASPSGPSSQNTPGEQALPAPLAQNEAAFAARRSRNPLVQALGRVWRMRMGKFGVVVVTLLVLTAIFAPVLAPYNPREQFRGDELDPPSRKYLLGTDQLGRDLLSRVIYASRASLIAGVLAVSFGAFVGVSTGLLAGYSGGWVDAVIMRIYDGLLTFPTILLAIAIVTATGPGLLNVAIAIGIAQVPVDARLTRSIVLSVRERDYILAARSIGVSGQRIVAAHILPNTLPPLLVQFSLAMGFAVLAEGSLSFLGLGTQPPTPSWGGMLADSRAFLRQAPWYGLYPGLALATLLVGLNFLADALREALDPRRINIAR